MMNIVSTCAWRPCELPREQHDGALRGRRVKRINRRDKRSKEIHDVHLESLSQTLDTVNRYIAPARTIDPTSTDTFTDAVVRDSAARE